MQFRRTFALTAVIAVLVALAARRAVAGDGEARSRRDLPHQGRRAAALEGDGDRKLPHRRVRPAAHRLAQHQGSRRLGAEDDEGLGPGQRPRGDVAVRPRLAEPALHRERRDAARLPAHRVPEGVDARHQRPGDRRRRRSRSSTRTRTSTTFRGKLRGKFVLAMADARRAGALRRAGSPLHRRRARRSREAAAGRRRTRTRQFRARRRTSTARRRSSGSTKASRRCSTSAAATAARCSCSRRRACRAIRRARRSRRR